jgi:CDP-4-dehydro-6-deoxyglucose reductase
MIQHIHLQQIPCKQLYLIFGCRTQQDLLYYNEMKTLSENWPSFTYLPTLSRETWEGAHGYVHNQYIPLCQNKPDARFYLCGWKGMIDEARQHLKQMGFSAKAIHVEIYG